jgi:hypothetical protein
LEASIHSTICLLTIRTATRMPIRVSPPCPTLTSSLGTAAGFGSGTKTNVPVSDSAHWAVPASLTLVTSSTMGTAWPATCSVVGMNACAKSVPSQLYIKYAPSRSAPFGEASPLDTTRPSMPLTRTRRSPFGSSDWTTIWPSLKVRAPRGRTV